MIESRSWFTHLLYLIAGGCIVMISLFVPVKVQSPEGLRQVALGYPIHWVEQDLSDMPLDPPDVQRFPVYLRFYSPLENITTASVPLFFASTLIVFIVLEAGVFLGSRFQKRKVS